jgi:hypothetical protein
MVWARYSGSRPDLVDESPAQRRRGGQPFAGEHQPGGAPAADPADHAHRAARTRYQAHPDFRQREEGVRRGHHPARVGRELGARADTGAVRDDRDLGRDPIDDPPRGAGEPDQAGRDEILRGAELVQVTTAAERRTRAGQLDRCAAAGR